MSGKCKRVCDFIYAHEDLIHITTFEEYRAEMRKVTNVIREAILLKGNEGRLLG